MPNWVYNNLTVSRKVWDGIKGKDENGNDTFTFNTIIPKPAAKKGSQMGITDMAVCVCCSP